MLKDLLRNLKETMIKLIKSRLFVAGVVFVGLFMILVSRLFYLQIVRGDQYADDYIKTTKQEIKVNAPRGNIYDRNGELLAYNEVAYSISIRDTGEYKKTSEMLSMILNLVNLLNKYEQSIITSIPMVISSNNEYEFSGTESDKKRFIRDVYGKEYIEKMAEKGEDCYSYSAEKVMDKLKASYQFSKWKEAKSLEKETELKVLNIRYSMSANSFQKYKSTTICKNVSDTIVAVIKENEDSLKGVSVETEEIRVYPDGEYFAHILGYTGKASTEELEELQKEDESYTTGDVVGKAGIEKALELYLKGEKGTDTAYLDSTGLILEVIDRVEPEVGNDVYLSIDKNLSISIYNMIEQELAGILYNKLTIDDFTPIEAMPAQDFLIPIKDVYFQMINNNILDMKHFAKEDVSQTEKDISAKYLQKLGQVKAELLQELGRVDAIPQNTLPEELQDYIEYIYSLLSNDSYQILRTDSIDKTDETYKKWNNGEISFREFMFYAMSKEWIDVSSMVSDVKYSSTEQLYQIILERLFGTDSISGILDTDTGFAKRIYYYLIQDEIITGNEICLALYEQNIIEKDTVKIANLVNGNKQVAFELVKEWIANLQLTPAQIALDPCSGGAVVTDTNTGELLAVVSYPGYDINQLSGTINADYYKKLTEDLSSPFYNRATQTRIAPGSTFKMISTIAGLEEGIVTPNTWVECADHPYPHGGQRCWLYRETGHGHGALNAVGALTNSCNYYFYDIGYRLSLDQFGNYNDELGLSRLTKYTQLFGFDSKTGIEINENAPHISTELPIASAIGQGSNNFTTLQLSRYVTAIANRGTVYNFSLVNKVVDSEGNVIQESQTTVKNTLEFQESTWDSVFQGMYGVTHDVSGGAYSLFHNMPVQVAGKTGTAQENLLRASHAHFVSFAPYENPEVSVSISLPNAYTSGNAIRVAKDVYDYYFGTITLEQVLNKEILNTAISNNSSINVSD